MCVHARRACMRACVRRAYVDHANGHTTSQRHVGPNAFCCCCRAQHPTTFANTFQEAGTRLSLVLSLVTSIWPQSDQSRRLLAHWLEERLQRRHAAVPVERQALRSAHEISSAWRWLARGIGVTHTTPGPVTPVLHLLLSRLSRYRNQIKSNHVGRVLVRVHNQKLNAHSSFFRAAAVPHFPDEAIKRVRPYGCLCHSCSDSSALALGGLPLAVRFGIT